MRLRHHRLEEAGLAQRLDPRAAGGVDVVVRQRRQLGVGPARQRVGEAAVIVVEERQRERVLEAAHGTTFSLSSRKREPGTMNHHAIESIVVMGPCLRGDDNIARRGVENISIALEHRLLLGGKGAERAREILGLHAQRLRHRLGLDRGLDRHRPFHLQHALGHGVGEGRPVGEDRARASVASASTVSGLREPVEEARCARPPRRPWCGR